MRLLAWVGGLAVVILLSVPALAIDVVGGAGYQGATVTVGSTNDGAATFDGGCPCQGSQIGLTSIDGGMVSFRGPSLKDAEITTSDGVLIGTLDKIGPDSTGALMIAVVVDPGFMSGEPALIAIFASSIRVVGDDGLQLQIDSAELTASIAAALQAGA